MKIVIWRDGFLLLVPTLIGTSAWSSSSSCGCCGDAASLQLQDAKSSAADEAALRAQLGLDQPIYLQYADWLGRLLHGDLGRSFRSKQPVAQELSARISRHARASASPR